MKIFKLVIFFLQPPLKNNFNKSVVLLLCSSGGGVGAGYYFRPPDTVLCSGGRTGRATISDPRYRYIHPMTLPLHYSTLNIFFPQIFLGVWISDSFTTVVAIPMEMIGTEVSRSSSSSDLLIIVFFFFSFKLNQFLECKMAGEGSLQHENMK